MEGMTDWNKLTVEQHIEHLEKEFLLNSSGTAKAVYEIIAAYRALKIHNVNCSFPTEKEVEDAAESFGKLYYSQDPNFANGCQAGWKFGAEWMKQKHNDH